jgi:type I restriction enzyme, S subunit
VSFPKYPRYKDSGIEWLKDSGIEWLDEVPDHWEVKRLRFVCEINPSKAEVSGLLEGYPVSFLPMEKVGTDGVMVLNETRSIGDVLQGFTYFRNEDVIVAKITPCFENGKGALCQNLTNGIGFGSTEFHVLRSRPGHDPKFIFYLTRSNLFRSLGEAFMIGSAGQKRVPEDFVSSFVAGFPPFKEQQVIATFLDRKTAELDELIRLNKRLIELLQEKRQALISHAVAIGLNPDAPMKDSGIEWLGKIPMHWTVNKVRRVTGQITNGFVGPTREILRDEGVRYIQSLHVKNQTIKFETPYFVEKEWSDEHSRSILRKGDLVIVQTGGCTGEVAIVPGEFEGSNCHALIILKSAENRGYNPYLLYVMISEYGRQSLESVQTGALHPHLNSTIICDIVVPSPPLTEQVAIAAYLDIESAKLDALVAKIEAAIERLQEHRTALISAAVTGKIDVREPASRAEAAAML